MVARRRGLGVARKCWDYAFLVIADLPRALCRFLFFVVGEMDKVAAQAGSDGKLAWAFREPIATLLLDGKTVGRHYAGPNWEHADGSAVVGKAVANVAGKTPSDIPWLKLEVTAHRGSGTLSGVTTVQRINTRGGVHAGACDQAGAFHSAPYAADYVFLKKGS
jgi:Protein of unknown function (DUF3455)